MNDVSRFTRRQLVVGAAALPFIPSLAWSQGATPAAATPIASPVTAEEVERIPSLVIDLATEPVAIDPASAYSDNEWSIVHSVYDALIGFDEDGVLQPIAAESLSRVDDTHWAVTLRPGMVFHDGSPVTADAIVRGFDAVTGEASLVSDLFRTVESVEVTGDLSATIVCSDPSPWLPAQMATWHVLLPEGSTPETRGTAPIGSGPYQFSTWDRGNEIRLERFDQYQPVQVKGVPIADEVRFHFVPDSVTRASNLVSGGTHVATAMPLDSVVALENAGQELRYYPVSGSAFVRVATDVEPFTDVRVRQAVNLALDVDSFDGTIVLEGSSRLASIHPSPSSMGFDASLPPYTYDRDQTIALLSDAGLEDGFSTRLEVTTAAQQSVAEAIAAQLDDVGIETEIVVSDYATFNANWTSTDAPPMRLVHWSPLFDPSTLLDLVWTNDGVLSRYDNADVTALIDEAAREMDVEARDGLYREIANVMHDDAPAIFLWNMVELAGVHADAALWSPRQDNWILPLHRVDVTN